MTDIICLRETIYRNQYRRNYVKNKKIFVNFFFLHFRNLSDILNIFQKKMALIADIFPEILAPKNMVR